MKKRNFLIIGIVALLMFVFGADSALAAPQKGGLPSQLNGFGDIATDVRNILYWAIWTLGPIFFLISLVRYMKSNDPGDKKDLKKWMQRIVGIVIAAQLVVWFLHDYLVNKFGTTTV